VFKNELIFSGFSSKIVSRSVSGAKILKGGAVYWFFAARTVRALPGRVPQQEKAINRSTQYPKAPEIERL
jgi:hypothetical protein